MEYHRRYAKEEDAKEEAMPTDFPQPVHAALAQALEKLDAETLAKAGEASGVRADYAQNFLSGRIKLVVEWLANSRELSNFTYPISPSNIRHMAWFVSTVTGKPHAAASVVIQEIVSDKALRDHYKEHASRFYSGRADPTPHWGRRVAWYALTRLQKPRLVVETGVHLGLGALAITSALLRNREEGRPGRYVGLEFSEQFGKLLCNPYAEVGEIRYGPSLESISTTEGPVDIFIHDSDHSYENETAEYEAIEDKLGGGALLISDNSHATDALIDYAERTGRRFLYWNESPRRHFYTGSGVGAAWHKRSLISVIRHRVARKL